jgi:PRTRC genetic system protein E
MTVLASSELAPADPALSDDDRVDDDDVVDDDEQHEDDGDAAARAGDDDNDDADDEQQQQQHDDDAADDDTAADATPVAAISEPIVMPTLDPAAIQPVFAGLASIIPPKGTLLLAIAKLSNGELRVTVQPPPAEGEPSETVLPLTVTGSVAELDADFVAAFAQYKPARDYASASAAEIARATKVAADQTRIDAEARRKKTTTPTGARKPSGTLTVTTTPTNAVIKVAANDGKTHDAKSGQKLTLAVGKATITATLAAHNTKLATVTIASGKHEALELTLPAAEPSLF